MGIYCTLAARQGDRRFFWATVPTRLLTSSMLWRHGVAVVGLIWGEISGVRVSKVPISDRL
jgi:hypothetical protein